MVKKIESISAAIVGCGGIGYWLGEGVARVLGSLKMPVTTHFVDGDVIEDKNVDRQFFPELVGMNKAEALLSLVGKRIQAPELAMCASILFVNKKTIKLHRKEWLKDGVIVFGAVDNNPSRVLLEEEIARLKNGVLIVGGNDEFEGQAQIYARAGGKDITPKIRQIAPEVLLSTEPIPGMDCLAQSVTQPQTSQANKAVALAMEILLLEQVLGRVLQGIPPTVNEVRVDVKNGRMQAFDRPAVA